MKPCIWFMSHLARSSAPQGISSRASSAPPGPLPSCPWLAGAGGASKGAVNLLTVWGFLGPGEYLDMKASVRWNEQWQFIIVIKGKGSQKKLRSLETLWRVTWHESGPMKQHPNPGVLSSTDCVCRGATGTGTCCWWGWATAWPGCSPGRVPAQPSGHSLTVPSPFHKSHTHTQTIPLPLPHLISWAWIQIGNTENSVKVPAIQYILNYAGNLAPGTLGRDDDKRNCSTLPKKSLQWLSVSKCCRDFLPVCSSLLSYTAEMLGVLR